MCEPKEAISGPPLNLMHKMQILTATHWTKTPYPDSWKTGIAANAAPLALTRNGLSQEWLELSDKIISLYLNCSEDSKFWMSKGLWFDPLQGARNYSLFQSMQHRLNPPSLLFGEYRELIPRGKAVGSWSGSLSVVPRPGMCGNMSRSHIIPSRHGV